MPVARTAGDVDASGACVVVISWVARYMVNLDPEWDAGSPMESCGLLTKGVVGYGACDCSGLSFKQRT